jgi:hypothetical protein
MQKCTADKIITVKQLLKHKFIQGDYSKNNLGKSPPVRPSQKPEPVTCATTPGSVPGRW